MTDTAPDVSAPPAKSEPTAGQRTQRVAGQLGATDIGIRLLTAFGWFGSSHWSAEQATSVALAAAFVVAASHNFVNWWSRRVPAIEAAAVAPPAPPPPVVISAGQTQNSAAGWTEVGDATPTPADQPSEEADAPADPQPAPKLKSKAPAKKKPVAPKTP